MIRLGLLVSLSGICVAVGANHADAQPVNITGNLLNSCVLSISSNGVLAAAADGTTISSTAPGGQPGTVSLVAIGLTPRVRFTAPALETPAGFAGTPITMIRYTSLRGAQQDWTATASMATAGALLDTFSVHGRVENAAGFASGRYNVQTVVTCEQ